MSAQKFVVSEDIKGERLDKALVALLIGKTRNYIINLIDDGNVLVNGMPMKSGVRLRMNDVITVDDETITEDSVLAEDIPLNIIYEDSDLIVVNKVAGMVVHPAHGHFTGTMVNALLFHCHDLSGINGVKRPGIVHRIDKDTSGLIVACKNDFTHEKIAKQLENHSMHREYYAIVKGVIYEEDGKIVAPIGRDVKERLKMGVDIINGKEATTYFHVLERFNQYTFLSCRLLTGRTHQIRVHMDYIGHGIEGDPLYGKGKNLMYDKGQLLHAYSITFKHPRSGETMTFDAPIPDYFELVLDKLRNE